MQLDPTQLQWGMSIVGDRTAHSQAIVPSILGRLVCACFQGSFNWADASDVGFQLGGSMPIGLDDGLGGVAQIVDLAQLMRNLGKDPGHSRSNGLLAIGNDPFDWYSR